ncbi:hypothetical protein [Kushneria phyllosphaerae]|uniref:hypothetical protein n=1 Tax=Kushneria phyllosphaerae TaxID=2100822 RepID=UPI001A9C9679|nr:hypothetical protein [Kushneria phyllosphaerae]
MKRSFSEVPDDFVHHHNHQIAHPVTQSRYWGTVVVTSGLLQQPGGPIVLRAGRHFGPHKGFGIRHIWTERGNDLKKWGYDSIYEVPNFVSDIIQHNANIVCEFSSMNGHQRLIVMRGSKGCAVLAGFETAEEDQLLYSVVTAYRNRSPNGKAVAKIEL